MLTKLRILVTGGRTYDDQHRLTTVLDRYVGQITALAQGAAAGADTLAARWVAQHPGVEHCVYRADWVKHGNSAGPIRNAEMLAHFKPDLVIAFSGGVGTRHMINIALDAGVSVLIVDGGAAGLSVLGSLTSTRGPGFCLKGV